MFNEIYVDDVRLPHPDSDINIAPDRVQDENETEAGTTMIIVTRDTKLTITGSWTVTGPWLEKFRAWRAADTVAVKCYYPSTTELTEHTCQLSIGKEKHVKRSREQLGETVAGLYQIDVTITEL